MSTLQNPPRRTGRTHILVRSAGAAVVAGVAVGGGSSVMADATATAYAVSGENDTAAVAAAPFAGWYAAADSFQNRVEVRDIRGDLRRTIEPAEFLALAPWMNLDGGPDGPSALAFSASGRLLFILLHDDSVPGDGQPSDAIFRLDLSTGSLTRQARLELFDRGDIWPHLAAAHHRSYLYVGKGNGQVSVFVASSATSGSSPVATWTLSGATTIRGIAIDRDAGRIYVASDNAVYRATLPANPATQPVFSTLAIGSDIRALAWGDHYGSAAQRGLYILVGTGPSTSRIDFVDAATAAAGTSVAPTPYVTTSTTWHDIAFTADGALLVGADEDASILRDTADTRLAFDAWVRDEIAQVTQFGRGLISPDGEPDGWVIDGDVTPGGTRFHPATPDGAGWTILLLMMNDAVNGDTTAQNDIRRILTRYAGFSPDNIRPVRNADGIFKHWINPATGNTEGTWPDEYATLSTMKIVFGAARAWDRYPDDPVIVRAASRIIFGTRNWHSYLQPGSSALAFKGLAGGGADGSSWSSPYHEGIIFAEQAGAYGNSGAQFISGQWFTRPLWPTATYVSGRPITVGAVNVHQPAFLTLYPALVSVPFRADASPGGWRAQFDNLRWSAAAWTDDSGPKYFTTFSAGTSTVGYNADTFTNHPGNTTTFTSLLALSAFGETAEAVGGYAAYRKGARQTFATGASILYRRPYDSTVFVPNSAGLPDVALGALGLGELAEPGIVDALLARPYPAKEMCPRDLTADGAIDVADLYLVWSNATDVNGDGAVTAADRTCLQNWLRRNESADAATR